MFTVYTVYYVSYVYYFLPIYHGFKGAFLDYYSFFFFLLAASFLAFLIAAFGSYLVLLFNFFVLFSSFLTFLLFFFYWFLLFYFGFLSLNSSYFRIFSSSSAINSSRVLFLFYPPILISSFPTGYCLLGEYALLYIEFLNGLIGLLSSWGVPISYIGLSLSNWF